MDVTSRLMNNLRVSLPGATDGAIRLAMWNVIDELCRTAGVWRDTISVQLTDGETEYPLTPPNGAEVVDILEITHNGQPIASSANGSDSPVVTMRGRIESDATQGDAYIYDPDEIGGSGVTSFAVFEPSIITINNPPDANALQFPLVVAVTLAPVAAVDDADFEDWLPDEVWRRQYQPLLNGTLGAMMGQIAKVYSNPTLAAFHQKRFRNQMGLARPDAEKRGQPRTQSWRFPRWA